jgi:diguanylate cyclase (GGDEF)-like protein
LTPTTSPCLRWLAAVSLSFCALAVPAQPVDVDALLKQADDQIRIDPQASMRLAEQALAAAGPDGPVDQRVRALLILCEHESERDRDAAQERLARAKALMPQVRQRSLVAYQLGCEGELREYAGDSAGALTLFEQAVLAAEQTDDRKALAQALYHRGYTRGVRGEFANGLSDLKRAAALYDELDLPGQRTTVFNGIAIVYNRMGDAEQARHFYTSALRYQQSAGLQRELVVTWHNLGRVHENLGDWDAAEQAFRASLAISRELDYGRGQAHPLRGLAGVLNATGRPADALRLLDEAAALLRDMTDERLRGQILLQRGIAYRQLGRGAEGHAALRDALAIFEKAQSPAEQAHVHEEWSRLHASEGDWRQAHAQLQAFKGLSDALLKRQIDDRFAAMKADVDRAAQAQEVRLLQREQQAMSLALEQERLAGKLRTAAIGFGTLAGGLLAVLAWRLRRSGMAMRHLAMTDELTGLPNRRDVLQRLDQMLARGERCALLIVDLDHFKRINDTHGHPAGDGVLRSSAEVLRAVGRPPVALGRLGGEEFVLLLPGGEPAAAAALAERVRAAVERMDVGAWVPDGHVTTSVGVTVSAPDERTSDLLRRADRALYLAKAGGRNRVCSVSPDDEFKATAPAPLTALPSTAPDRSPLSGPRPNPRPGA